MHRSLRSSGVAAVCLIWGSLVAGTVRTGFDLVGARPISHLGTLAGSAVLFTTGLALGALLLVVFHGSVRDRYVVSRGFSVAMLVGLAGQLVAAFVPIGGDSVAHRVHTASALVLGASLPVLM